MPRLRAAAEIEAVFAHGFEQFDFARPERDGIAVADAHSEAHFGARLGSLCRGLCRGSWFGFRGISHARKDTRTASPCHPG
jgi:hypothetical protein